MIRWLRITILVIVLHGATQITRLAQRRPSTRAAAANVNKPGVDSDLQSPTRSYPESEIPDIDVLGLEQVLDLKPQAAWVRRYFSMAEVARALLHVGRVANASAWPEGGPSEHSTKSAEARPVFAIAVLTGAHACLFDNFVSHLMRLQQPSLGGLVFPPLAVFSLDLEAEGWCKRISRAANVDATGGLFLLCASPANATKEHRATDMPQVFFGDAAYRSAVWMKPMLLSMALSAGDFSVLVNDVDIVWLRPPLVLHTARFRTPTPSNPPNNLRSRVFHPVIEVACELGEALATANTGLIFSWAGSQSVVDRWATIARLPPPADDQAAFRQKVGIAAEFAGRVACLSSDKFKMRCSCNGRQCDDRVVAVHCTEVANKTFSLEAGGFWAPKLMNQGHCRYGVGPAWWKSHPKASAAAAAARRAAAPAAAAA
jgi:hypothetical protein